MRKLEKHITKLLLNNDCVIVPGFGGFITHHIPAAYDEKENVYIPPSRTIGFNPQLVMNDSVLVQDYVNVYDVSYPEALKCIEMDVDDFKNTINNADGGYEISGIGRIYMLDDGRYDFLPNSSGITTPQNYGFVPIELQQLTSKEEAIIHVEEQQVGYEKTGVQTVNDVATSLDKQKESDKDESRDGISVHIPLAVFHQIAAACIMLFIMLSVPSKLGEAGRMTLKESSIGTSWLYEMMPKERTTGTPNTLMAINGGTSPIDKASASCVKSEESHPCYSIVLASRITGKNASAYIQKLQNNGMKDVRIYKNEKMIMVIYKSFATRQEANQELKKLSSNVIFADSWVIELK